MEMYLRQVTAKVLRKLRIPSQNVSFSSYSGARATNALPNSLSRKTKCSHAPGSGGSRWKTNHRDPQLWIILAGQAAIFFGINANVVLADASVESSSENDSEGTSIIGLRKIEDGSVKSNIHTSKWRIFTDNGREYFLQGKLDQAENFFFSALHEAKEGFGDRDPHVASACNNLAELYRVKKQFDKAEPLYLEGIEILEESFGTEDVRVGAALHNLGQFYLMQRKMEEARKCYERALKIKGRVLGLGNADYADTMYHLGMVLYLLGKEKDAEVLIQESIRILEENGQGESFTCLRRLRYLAEIYLKSNRLAEAENVQRKILHIMELSKGWNSMDTVIAAEALALVLESVGNLKEGEELLERCLEARKTLLPEDHIQIAANILHLARVAMLDSNRVRKIDISKAISELDKAKDLLCNSTRSNILTEYRRVDIPLDIHYRANATKEVEDSSKIKAFIWVATQGKLNTSNMLQIRRLARQVLNKLRVQIDKKQKNGVSEEIRREGRTALVILLQSLDALGLLEVTKQELQSMEENLPNVEAENSLLQCISAYKEFEAERLISDSPEIKSEYLSCLKHLLSLYTDSAIKGKATLLELTDEIKRVEGEISRYRKRKPSAGGRF